MANLPGQNVVVTPPLPNVNPAPPLPSTQAWLDSINAENEVKASLIAIMAIITAHPEMIERWKAESQQGRLVVPS